MVRPMTERSEHEAARGQRLRSLRELSRVMPESDDLKQMLERAWALATAPPGQTTTYEHRSLAITQVALLEGDIEALVLQSLPNKDESTVKALLSDNGVLGSFANAITLAHALKLITVETRDELTRLRHIRNTFAHARSPVTFETKEIAHACSQLQPDIHRRPSAGDIPLPPGNAALQRFVETCANLKMVLAWKALKLTLEQAPAGVLRGRPRDEVIGPTVEALRQVARDLGLVDV